MTDQIADSSQRAYARFAGLMYFVVLGFDIVGLIIVSGVAGGGSFLDKSHRIIASEQLYRIGLCFGLVGSLSTILLAVALYVTVRPVDRNLAMTAALFRVVEAATGALGSIIAFNILRIYLAANHANAFDTNQLGALVGLNSGGSEVGAIFYSFGSILFFYLFLKSNYIPRILSSWGIFASAIYAAVWFLSLILPQYSATATVYGSVPALLAELSTGLWLLIMGIKVQTRNHADSERWALSEERA